MKIHALLLCLLAVALGCSKKNDPAPVTGCQVSSIATAFTGGTQWIQTFSYSGSSVSGLQFKTVDGGTTTSSNYNYTYDGSGRLTNVTLVGTAQSTDFASVSLTYSGSNTSPSVVKVTLGDGSYNQTTYTYNSTMQVTQAVVSYFDATSNTTTSSYQTFSYPNSTTHNASSVENYTGLPADGNASIATYEYTYDTHSNPESGYDLVGGSFATTNNVVTFKATTHTSSGDFSSTITYTYTYNSKGYPTKKTYLFTNLDPNSTVTITYSYTNCN